MAPLLHQPAPRSDIGEVLLDVKHGQIALHAESRRVWFYRTSTPFESLEECEAAWAQIVAFLEDLDRPSLRILVDLRDGPMRSDEGFEKIGQQYRQRLTAGFERAALLVRTMAGRLQLSRHQREEQFSVAIFDDEALALEFLAQGDDLSPR